MCLAKRFQATLKAGTCSRARQGQKDTALRGRCAKCLNLRRVSSVCVKESSCSTGASSVAGKGSPECWAAAEKMFTFTGSSTSGRRRACKSICMFREHNVMCCPSVAV